MLGRTIENERLRLHASALNMASASSFVAGVLVPTVATLSGNVAHAVSLRVLGLTTGGCLLVSLVLHRAACEVLEGLRE